MSTEPPADPTVGSPARRRRGRRPAAEVRADVLEATAALLFDEGIAAVTFERVAARSGASKTTIYKWWASPGALAAEAYFARSAPELHFPDTGDIATDVRTQLRAFVRLLTERGGGRVVGELIGVAQTDAALSAALSEGYTAPRRALAVAYFERARRRGQLREDVDLQILVDQLWGACYNRLLVPDAPLTEAFADALVENALHGAASAEYRVARG
ncbi:TetR/AcrR family transcriptional regulator [Patulibacter sp. S7RM1-6]